MTIGAWPFDCEKNIPCGDLPHQTCGCDHFVNDGSIEKMGIVYHLGTGSEISNKIDFKSCEELKSHGVTISGHFMIDGQKTYCSNWSKFVLDLIKMTQPVKIDSNEKLFKRQNTIKTFEVETKECIKFI